MTAPSVLSPSFKPSDNFWNSDVWLRHFVRQHTNDEARWYMTDKWVNLGRQVATELNDLSMKADKNPPQLRKRNFYGDGYNSQETIGEGEFPFTNKRLTRYRYVNRE